MHAIQGMEYNALDTRYGIQGIHTLNNRNLIQCMEHNAENIRHIHRCILVYIQNTTSKMHNAKCIE